MEKLIYISVIASWINLYIVNSSNYNSSSAPRNSALIAAVITGLSVAWFWFNP